MTSYSSSSETTPSRSSASSVASSSVRAETSIHSTAQRFRFLRRAPELMPPVVLDQAFLAESRLAGTPPERETERQILGSPGTASLRSRPIAEEKRS